MVDPQNNVKILFRFYSDVMDKWMVETMWADMVDEKNGLYKIDNIPFYAPMVASDDIVRAEYDEDEGCITYRETVQPSGNSTVWVILLDKKRDTQGLRKMFAELGCQSEGMNDGNFAMEIPAKVNYTPVRAKLIELEEQGIISYSEP
jgi:hypothetical protein